MFYIPLPLQTRSCQFELKFRHFYTAVSRAIEEVLLLFQYLYTQRQSCASRRRSSSAARKGEKKTAPALDLRYSRLKLYDPASQKHRIRLGHVLQSGDRVLCLNYKQSQSLRHNITPVAALAHRIALRARLYL